MLRNSGHAGGLEVRRRDHLSECGAFQLGQVIGVGLVKGEPEFAAAFAAAIVTALIGCARQAIQRRNWPIDEPQQRTDMDQVGGLQQLITTVAATAAGDVSGGPQRREDLFDEFARQLFLFAKFADVEATARCGTGEGNHGLEGVAGAL